MKKFLILPLLISVLLAGRAWATPPDDALDVIKHLEFIGYKATMDSKRITAKHDQELNIFLRAYRGGILLTAFFGGSDYGKSHRSEWMQLINRLNMDAAAARYYIDNDGDMVIEAYYPGRYEKQAFSTFMDTFHLERSRLSDMSDDVNRFID